MSSNRLFPLKIQSALTFLMSESIHLKYVKNVLLANNIIHHSEKENNEEQNKFWSRVELDFFDVNLQEVDGIFHSGGNLCIVLPCEK
ncbi:hypothetical protein Lal_00022994, partial [Lupinus albus]